MKKKIILIIVFLCNLSFLFSQPQVERTRTAANNIYEIVNKEIILQDTWAGQSITLIYENDNYYIYREIYGSGLPVVGYIKYNVIFDSEYKITFSEIIATSENFSHWNNRDELFEIFCRNEIAVYLNGIKLYINRME